MSTKTSIVETAILYAEEYKWSVFPVSKDKKPLIKWKGCQSEIATEKQIRKWWKQFPNALIGIATGAISNLSVIDVDTDKGGKVPKGLPITRSAKTQSGGWHFYFTFSEVVPTGTSTMAKAVDTRSEGGYVVAPPSEGTNGKYEWVIEEDCADFPVEMIPEEARVGSKHINWSEVVQGTDSGTRNETATQFIGKLLPAFKKSEWKTVVFPMVQDWNKKNTPPMPEKELRDTFVSICKRQSQKQSVLSPIQPKNQGMLMRLDKTGNGQLIKDLKNAVNVLRQSIEYRDVIKYNSFKRELEYKGNPLTDNDILSIQSYLQGDIGMRGIAKQTVGDAIYQYGYEKQYDEALDWLESLQWDGEERLEKWFPRATGTDDDSYHRAIGAQWWFNMVKRLVQPACIFDHVLVVVGGQGVGKTSMFRIIGGDWYKSYTGAVENKDFYIQTRGCCILDLDEGSAMYKSESIKLKSIVTTTVDEFRAPYERTTQQHKRRFVFSMSTNDTEPFHDTTGNRRYWVADIKQVDFNWLTENRDQLFAEAYHKLMNKIPVIDVPMDEALLRQESHLPEDGWTDTIKDWLQKRDGYIERSKDFAITVEQVYTEAIQKEGSIERFARKEQMRISDVLKKLKFHKQRMRVGGDQRWRWVLTDEEVAKGEPNNETDTKEDF